MNYDLHSGIWIINMKIKYSLQETIPEKQNAEDQEKEVSVEKDPHPLAPARPNVANHHTDQLGPSQPGKRASDTLAAIGDEHSPPLLPPKRRPVSSYVSDDESIHRPEDGGMTVLELVEHVKEFGRKGLFHDYAIIKNEPPAGTFDISKWVQTLINTELDWI